MNSGNKHAKYTFLLISVNILLSDAMFNLPSCTKLLNINFCAYNLGIHMKYLNDCSQNIHSRTLFSNDKELEILLD